VPSGPPFAATCRIDVFPPPDDPADSDSPVGSDPADTAHVYGDWPPEADSCCAYDVPTVPDGSDVGVMVIAPPAAAAFRVIMMSDHDADAPSVAAAVTAAVDVSACVATDVYSAEPACTVARCVHPDAHVIDVPAFPNAATATASSLVDASVPVDAVSAVPLPWFVAVTSNADDVATPLQPIATTFLPLLVLFQVTVIVSDVVSAVAFSAWNTYESMLLDEDAVDSCVYVFDFESVTAEGVTVFDPVEQQTVIASPRVLAWETLTTVDVVPDANAADPTTYGVPRATLPPLSAMQDQMAAGIGQRITGRTRRTSGDVEFPSTCTCAVPE
jgi:hypothetical protein